MHYDPVVITAAELIAVHLQTHAATAAHALRSKYRSAVYAFDEHDAGRYGELVDELAINYTAPLQTRVLPFVDFLPSLPGYQDYYRSDPERPFCRRYIAPKLDRLRRDRPDLFFPNKQ